MPAEPAAPTRTPNVHPACRNVPGSTTTASRSSATSSPSEDPDTALCGKDVSGYPWNPPWPRCEACLAVARGEQN